ncbi:MAG: hypothetical protein E3J88_05485 [Anaerolineales bacterium]|nr:MAG: hypothetical protein E3J88_05485 [Anaerolineales bacterium]
MRKIKSLEWFLLVMLSPVSACSMIGGDANAEPEIPSPSATTPRGGGGEKIAFLSGEYGNREINVMDTEGRGQTRLTYSEESAGIPVWSPDGSMIAFRVSE